MVNVFDHWFPRQAFVKVLNVQSQCANVECLLKLYSPVGYSRTSHFGKYIPIILFDNQWCHYSELKPPLQEVLLRGFNTALFSGQGLKPGKYPH